MSKNKIKVFIILRVLNDHTKEPLHAFIQPNREEAKLFAENWTNIFQQKGTFELREIANYENNKINEEDIFICYIRNTIDWNKPRETIKERVEKIARASKEKELKEQIKILFDAREIND